MAGTQTRVKVFISYSHKDGRFFDALIEQMKLLQRQGVLEAWHDRRITAGSEWAGEIDRELESAEIILLLVSASFLASDYCYDVEMTRALERQAAGDAWVIPIILRACDWQSAPFGKLKSLPTDGKPVTAWKRRDEAYANIVEGIRALVANPRRTPGLLPITNVRLRRNLFFAGRENIFQRLRDGFRGTKAAAWIQVLSGLGGLGKSQIALEYIYRFRNEYEAIFWIRADNVAELQGDFLGAAKLLKLVTNEVANAEAAAMLVRQWLGTRRNWLLVFDNADDPDLLRDYLPENEFGHVIVTSRSSEFDVLGVAEPINMSSMTQLEATNLLFLRTKCDRNNPLEEAAAAELVKELGYLPLALEQAGACITALSITIQVYLETFRYRKLSLLEEFRPVAGDYRSSVATTWSLNFSEVERISRSSADLLRVCSFLRPDNIPLELFTLGGSRLGPYLQHDLENAHRDRLALPRLLRPLRRYSLIQLERGSNTVVIHRLVQEVVQSGMDAETRTVWAERTIDALIQALPIDSLQPADAVIHLSRGLDLIAFLPAGRERDLREVTVRSLLGPSLIATSGYASTRVGEVYLGAERICRQLGRPETTFRVRWGLWGYHYVRADLQIALQLASELLQSANSEGDSDRGHLIEAHRAMASTLFTIGKIAESRAYFRQSIAIYDPDVHARHAETYAADPAIVCRSYLTVCELLVYGELEGLRECRRVLASARAQRHPFSKGYSLFWAACFHQLRREPAKARRIADKGVEFCRQYQFRQWEAMNQIISGWCVAQQGDSSNAARCIEQALSEHQRTGAQTLRPYFLLLLGEAQACCQQLTIAHRSLDQALECAARFGEETWTAEILRTRGEIELKEHPDSIHRPEALFRRAIDTAREQGAPLFELRGWISLSGLLAKIGRTEEFRSIMRDVLTPRCHQLPRGDERAYRALTEILDGGERSGLRK
jgi:predicted ATPase